MHLWLRATTRCRGPCHFAVERKKTGSKVAKSRVWNGPYLAPDRRDVQPRGRRLAPDRDLEQHITETNWSNSPIAAGA